jgi:hypothetical protein
VSGKAVAASSNAGPLKLLPFTEIKDEPYNTYLSV